MDRENIFFVEKKKTEKEKKKKILDQVYYG